MARFLSHASAETTPNVVVELTPEDVQGLAMLDENVAEGSEVTVVWGEPNGGTKKPSVERHVQTNVRATVSYSRLNESS